MHKIPNCILLIDDDKSTNVYNAIVLEEAGVAENIRFAHNGVEALDYLKMNATFEKNGGRYIKPDLILLDLKMPDMNGYEFLEEFEKIDENLTSSSVVIMLTTALNPKAKESLEKVRSVQGFWNKPLDISSVKKMVGEYFKP